MAKLILNGSTSGSVTLESPAVSGTTTLTLPATSGTVITTASTFGGTGPAFRAFQTGSQSISSSTWTKITFNSEDFDTNNNFASSRFTPTVAGYYQISANVRMTSMASGNNIGLQIYKNGSANSEIGNANEGAAGDASRGGSSLIYFNGSTDYVEIYLYQSNASAKSTVDGTQYTWFTGALVRAA